MPFNRKINKTNTISTLTCSMHKLQEKNQIWQKLLCKFAFILVALLSDEVDSSRDGEKLVEKIEMLLGTWHDELS